MTRLDGGEFFIIVKYLNGRFWKANSAFKAFWRKNWDPEINKNSENTRNMHLCKVKVNASNYNDSKCD